MGIGNVTHITDVERKAELPLCYLVLSHSVHMRSTHESTVKRDFPREQESYICQTFNSLSLLDPRETHRHDLGQLQSSFDADNSVLQSRFRMGCETKEGLSSYYWELFYLLQTAGCCYTVCASLIYDTCCCLGAYLLKLVWFVLFLSCLHMVYVYVCFANLSWHLLSSQSVFVHAIFGMLWLIDTLQWKQSKLQMRNTFPAFSCNQLFQHRRVKIFIYNIELSTVII